MAERRPDTFRAALVALVQLWRDSAELQASPEIGRRDLAIVFDTCAQALTNVLNEWPPEDD
jgi:hypothetical protein